MKNLFFDLPIELQFLIYSKLIVNNIKAFELFYRDNVAKIKSLLWSSYSEFKNISEYEWYCYFEGLKKFNTLRKSELDWWIKYIKRFTI